MSSRNVRWGGVSLLGVLCLAFGVGEAGVGWIARLARSAWFAGLEPRAGDLHPGDVSCGAWVAPVDVIGNVRRIASATEAFFTSAALPEAAVAAVAVPQGASASDLAAALGLVTALRQRRNPCGRRIDVIVTVEVPPPSGDPFVRQLQDLNAFAVRAGVDAAGDHLHHFPLGAITLPRRGQLVGVDLADYLRLWRPGRVANLHVIPFDFDAAEQTLRCIAVTGPVCALTLNMQIDMRAPDSTLGAVDRLASHCRAFFLGQESEEMVFTTRDRLDGKTGFADLLVIHERTAAA